MKYPITLKPQGAIARNLKMKIQLTPLPPPIKPVTELTITNVLNVGVADTLPAYTECTLVVFINEPLDGDLDVTVSVLSGDDVRFLNSDSPPEYTEIATTVTIAAGQYFATVPFETGAAQTGDVTVTATADGYADATGAFAIVCETVVDDILVTVEYAWWNTGFPVYSHSGSFFARDADLAGSTGHSIDVPVGNLKVIQVLVQVITRGRLCPGDTFSFAVTNSGSGLMSVNTTVGENDIANPYLQPSATLLAVDSYFANGNAFMVGDIFTVSTKMNGVLIDNDRATFTVNVVT